MRFWHLVSALAPMWWIGCAHGGGGEPPPCPRPTMFVSVELSLIFESEMRADHLHAWLSDITIYCDAIDAMRR